MIKSILNEQELKKLADVISKIEKKTSGELRLMIVGRSITTGHVLPLIWFFLMTTSLMLIWVERERFAYAWNLWLMPALVAGSFALAWALSRLPLMQRILTYPSDISRQVWLRAELEFYREGLSQTKDRTGVLIFVSLLERRAVVLGDRGISEKLKADAWAEVIAKVLEGPRTGQWAVKLEEALNMCGEQLAHHFPIKEGDKNELPNHVIVKP